MLVAKNTNHRTGHFIWKPVVFCCLTVSNPVINPSKIVKTNSKEYLRTLTWNIRRGLITREQMP